MTRDGFKERKKKINEFAIVLLTPQPVTRWKQDFGQKCRHHKKKKTSRRHAKSGGTWEPLKSISLFLLGKRLLGSLKHDLRG